MNELVPQLLAVALSGMVFMFVSIKFGWSTRFWTFVNKRIKPQYNFILWIIIVFVLSILVQVLYDIIGLPYSQITNGVTIGFWFAFLPSLINKKL